jgi:hypothetical protein
MALMRDMVFLLELGAAEPIGSAMLRMIGAVLHGINGAGCT